MEEISIQPKHYLTCLWPGMAELWWRGRVSALPTAVAFAAVVNALLVAKFIYSDWLSGGLVMLACWVVAAAWVVLTVRSIRELPLLLTPRRASAEPDPFPQAQLAYLQADYAEAEKLLNETLAIEPRDPPALLLLSSIYRHSGRLHASQLLLAEVRKLEVAEQWELEFAAEQARLQRDIESRAEADPEEEAQTAEEAPAAEETSAAEEAPAAEDAPAAEEKPDAVKDSPGEQSIPEPPATQSAA
ncbi:hypothetical protein [Allorhodopirellula solitaria]|uniref:Tetratricopeptide repeat protein n=1 Tax=Allorhodopirellula solitaria TaxID=2527987 RepID=A0A5C5YJ99_9BACT|nr:hypothetical protein [Allorhodopirellula solitaria]TWT74948.1 hypothetical protein CA85_02360 [Allorhodopirellula solitaria]